MEKRPILIIDDDPKVCELITSVLTGAGLEVLAASDGLRGIETARAAQPTVILLDMMMPGLDGIETCKRLKQEPALERIPVVGITGSTDLSYTEKAFRAGARFFLPKPFGAESLVQVVELAAEVAHPETAMQHTRHHPRFPVELPIRCLVRGDAETAQELVGQTENVSLGGFQVLLSKALEPGTVLRLRLDLADGPITAYGTVVWQYIQVLGEGKIPHGIQFLHFQEDADLVQYRRFLSELAAGDVARAR